MRFFWILLIPFLPVPKVNAEGLFFDFLWNFSPGLTSFLFLVGIGIYTAIKLTRFYSRFLNLEKQVEDIIPKVDLRFKQVDHRLDQMEKRLDKIDNRFDKIDEKFDKIEEKFERLFSYITDNNLNSLRKTK